MTDLISRADAIEELQNCIGLIQQDGQDYLDERDIPLLNTAIDALKALPSADAEPKWNCTASFVAEQLDRLRKMTDEERWEFFKKFFEIKGGAE